jgi:hypothetical protein
MPIYPSLVRIRGVRRHHVAETLEDGAEADIVVFLVAGGVGVAHHDDLVVEHHRVPRRGFAAEIGQHADDGDILDAALGELLRQVGLARDEGAEPAFGGVEVARRRLQHRV